MNQQSPTERRTVPWKETGHPLVLLPRAPRDADHFPRRALSGTELVNSDRNPLGPGFKSLLYYVYTV